MGPRLSQSQPLFSPKRNPVYLIFDILVCQSKCQIPPVGYHYFENFGGGKYINPQNYLKPFRGNYRSLIRLIFSILYLRCS